MKLRRCGEDSPMLVTAGLDLPRGGCERSRFSEEARRVNAAAQGELRGPGRAGVESFPRRFTWGVRVVLVSPWWPLRWPLGRCDCFDERFIFLRS